MSVALASTWRPHGELPRLLKLLPFLKEIYDGTAIAMPLEVADGEEVAALRAIPSIKLAINADWPNGVRSAVEKALELETDHIHYVDLDRLLHWAETRPDELKRTVAEIEAVDCLVIGRTNWAFGTHPLAQQETERLINVVISHLMGHAIDREGREADVCAGSRGYSHLAARYAVQHAERDAWTDGHWPVLLHRAGFSMGYVEVDGLDWETADRHLPRAADADTQRHVAEEFDRNVENWHFRVRLAHGIIEGGIRAASQEVRG